MANGTAADMQQELDVLQRSVEDITRTKETLLARIAGPEGAEPSGLFEEMARIEEASRQDRDLVVRHHEEMVEDAARRAAAARQGQEQFRALERDDDSEARIEELERHAADVGVAFDSSALRRAHTLRRGAREAASNMLEASAQLAETMGLLHGVLALGLDRSMIGQRRVKRARRWFVVARAGFLVLAILVSFAIGQAWGMVFGSASALVALAAVIVDNRFGLVVAANEERVIRRIVKRAGEGAIGDRMLILTLRLGMLTVRAST